MKSVSVVISTYSTDRYNYVLDCIESLRRQTLQPEEIILVLDPRKSLVDFYRSHLPNHVKIVISEDFGLSTGRNAGVKSAKGEVIAFVDDDTFASENWLKNLVQNYDIPCVLGAGGLVKPVWENNRPLWFPEELDWAVGCSYEGYPRYKTYIQNPVGCNMSFRRNVFDKVGYFRTNIGRFGKTLISGEDREFSMRILRNINGSRIVYDPSAIIYHKIPSPRARLKYLVKRLFYGGLSISLMLDYFESHKRTALTVENFYLKYLLKAAIPMRLKRIYKAKNLLGVLILVTSMFLVLTGYLIGRFASRRT